MKIFTVAAGFIGSTDEVYGALWRIVTADPGLFSSVLSGRGVAQSGSLFG